MHVQVEQTHVALSYILELFFFIYLLFLWGTSEVGKRYSQEWKRPGILRGYGDNLFAEIGNACRLYMRVGNASANLIFVQIADMRHLALRRIYKKAWSIRQNWKWWWKKKYIYIYTLDVRLFIYRHAVCGVLGKLSSRLVAIFQCRGSFF